MGQYLRWLFFSALTGTAVGLFASLFSWCLNQATALRTRNQYMFLTLPLGGLLIVFLYKAFHYENNGGTDSVIESIHSKIIIPFRMAFLIFCSTIITILCGGSVGREGAALQIGGSMGKKLGDLFHFNETDKKIILMSGMAAAFSALFGTPMAAAFFAIGGLQCGHYVLTPHWYPASVPPWLPTISPNSRACRRKISTS